MSTARSVTAASASVSNSAASTSTSGPKASRWRRIVAGASSASGTSTSLCTANMWRPRIIAADADTCRRRIVEQVAASSNVVDERRRDEGGVLQHGGRCVRYDVWSGGGRFGGRGQPGEPVEVESALGEQVAGDVRIGEDRPRRLAVARQRLHQRVHRVGGALHRRAAGLVRVVAERRREPGGPGHVRPGQVLGVGVVGRRRPLVFHDGLGGRNEEVAAVVDSRRARTRASPPGSRACRRSRRRCRRSAPS